MVTQQFPVYDEPLPLKVRIGAGTALKVGFFFAFGVTLFSLIISAIAVVLAVIFGAGLLSDFRQLFGS